MIMDDVNNVFMYEYWNFIIEIYFWKLL
jgi:hypothetical protein